MIEIPRYTKQLLYSEIANIRSFFGISPKDYPLDMKRLCSAGGLVVGEHSFKTKGLQGMLSIDADRTGYIILNANNSPREQNFFCGHEGLHYLLHPNAGVTSFQCFEFTKNRQRSIMEWQANEGAAE